MPFIELFFCKKKYLLVGASGVCYEQVNGWASERCMIVFHINHIGPDETTNQISCFCYRCM